MAERISAQAYTIKFLLPEFSPNVVSYLSAYILETDLLKSRHPIASSEKDVLTLTFWERPFNVGEHMRMAVMLARISLQDIGVNNPIVINVLSTRLDNVSLIDAHVTIVLGEPLLERMDLTDRYLSEELSWE